MVNQVLARSSRDFVIPIAAVGRDHDPCRALRHTQGRQATLRRVGRPARAILEAAVKLLRD